MNTILHLEIKTLGDDVKYLLVNINDTTYRFIFTAGFNQDKLRDDLTSGIFAIMIDEDYEMIDIYDQGEELENDMITLLMNP